MALKKFELKQAHIALIKNLVWDDNIAYINTDNGIEDTNSPFGGSSLTEDLGLIIYGKVNDDFDHLSEETVTYTAEQVSEMFTIFEELRTALEIVTYTSSFEVGHYRSKWYDKTWKKYTPKEK